MPNPQLGREWERESNYDCCGKCSRRYGLDQPFIERCGQGSAFYDLPSLDTPSTVVYIDCFKDNEAESDFCVSAGSYSLPTESWSTTADVWVEGPNGVKYEDGFKKTSAFNDQCVSSCEIYADIY
ncbi:hypothetical protein AG1IA_09877 [Rhizoctonia solani AG-1 IA]|uniref:Uncharacterized protein n=1 Tax=Thanatephorus cucumeris (strain AG1-IA) TaxID=983506 RepID=L8WH37_THACA|nr:hypothetical protein AG1IA_09877 [Rhizoctonia solani AG-1 IA]